VAIRKQLQHFSLVCRLGVTNAQIWYSEIGADRITPTDDQCDFHPQVERVEGPVQDELVDPQRAVARGSADRGRYGVSAAGDSRALPASLQTRSFVSPFCDDGLVCFEGG
jgi:hypothetical protein